MNSIATVGRVKVSADGHGVVSHAGVECCARWRTGPGCPRRSPTFWRTLTGARGPIRRVRCSPIWPRRWPTARTASTVSHSAAATASTCSARPRRRPRCGGWSINVSTPRTCPVSAPPARTRGSRRGRPVRHRSRVGGCTWTSTRRSRSITPTTRRTPRRRGRRPSAITRCWCFWIVPRSPAGKHSRGCCDPGTPEATPPPITSRCWGGRWPHCPKRIGRTPMILGHRRFWCVRTPRAPPTVSPRRAVARGSVLLRLRRRRARARRGGAPQPARTRGCRRSSPVAGSATAPGAPRPPGWSSCRPGRSGVG